MAGHGYRVGSLASLIRMRDHGVTPDYIAALARHDVRDIPADDVVRLRDHGVDAEFVGELRQIGYGPLPVDAMIQLRDHGVDADYIRTLVRHGIRDVPPADLARLRDHGVTPDFVAALRANGYDRSNIEGSSGSATMAFVGSSARCAAGYGGFGTDEIIRLRDHGVTDSYVGELSALGYTSLSAEDIARLRDHGVMPDFIRNANRGGGRHKPDELIRLRTAASRRAGRSSVRSCPAGL